MITVIGTTTLDLFFTGTKRIPGVGGDEFVPEGFAFLDEPVSAVIGGNAGNTTYALARLGSATSLCSFVGRDTFGSILRGWLSDAGVDLEALVVRDDWATSCTGVIIDRDLHRLSVHHAGGAAEYGPEMIDPRVIDGSDALLLSSYHLLPRLRAGAGASILAQAKHGGAITALDLGPIIEPNATIEEIGPILAHTDYVLSNEYEISMVTGDEDLERAAQVLRNAGATVVVSKRGPDGVSIFGRDGRFDVPAFEVTATGTVGAGDSFNAGFLQALSLGADLTRAAVIGSAVAAMVVEAPTGVLAAPTAADVESFLRERT